MPEESNGVDPEEQLREAYRSKRTGAPAPDTIAQAEEKFLKHVEEGLQRTAPLLPPRADRASIPVRIAKALRRGRLR